MPSRPCTTIVLILIVFVASLAWLTRDLHVGNGGDDRPPFHLDEAHKIGESFYYHVLFEENDPSHPAWTEDFYARINPPVGKYIFGAALAVGGRPVRNQQIQHDFDELWYRPDELRKLVPDQMLRITRGTSAVFGAAVCALLFLIAYRVAGMAAGLIAVALLLGNPWFQQYAVRGLTDTILLFHLTLIVPVTMVAVNTLRRDWQGNLGVGAFRRWSILFLATIIAPGLVVALAAGSKLNGAITGPVYAVSLALGAGLSRDHRPAWRRGVQVFTIALLTAIAAVSVFLIINPYYHDGPIARTMSMLAMWNDLTVKHQICPGFGLFTIQQKTTAAGYCCLRAASLPLPQLLAWVNLDKLGTWLTVLGFAAGLTYLGGRCLPSSRGLRSNRPAEGPGDLTRLDAAVVMCWVLAVAVATTLWLPLSWDRYLLPPYLAICLTTAIGLGTLPRQIQATAEVFSRKVKGNRVWRIAAGMVCAGALWIVLSFTSWVISPLMLRDPTALSDPRTLTRPTDSPIALHHLGLFALHLGMGDQAADKFDRSLLLLDRNFGDCPWMPVMRCCVLYDLARARAASGHLDGGRRSFRDHIAALESFRDSTESADPFIREVYDQIIDIRQKEWSRFIQERPASD